MGFNIAIDGPAGAGKSTVARQAAEKLGFLYVDTGAMYRTIALYMLKNNIDTADDAALAEALEKINIDLNYENGLQHMLLNGEDVTGQIRTEEVSLKASETSAKQIVRDKLTDLQRGLAEQYNVLMDGRDIGTKILPDADLKIFLTASAGKRAHRRFLELTAKGEECDEKSIQKEIEERDYRDMHRESSPLKQAADAILLDSSDIDADTAVRRIVEMVEQRIH